jgi:hypothetical protein
MELTPHPLRHARRELGSLCQISSLLSANLIFCLKSFIRLSILASQDQGLRTPSAGSAPRSSDLLRLTPRKVTDLLIILDCYFPQLKADKSSVASNQNTIKDEK